ncbi:hypothetical protein RR46_05037 [Papilio xuthus]|uniref:Uncharacterized protein n=1 Tax=Papilio xuthus TaxID=66420 RepID=A0A194PUB5_PAPXU|nr:hypothetical protein RR46_05037 [Papilio xuthus]
MSCVGKSGSNDTVGAQYLPSQYQVPRAQMWNQRRINAIRQITPSKVFSTARTRCQLVLESLGDQRKKNTTLLIPVASPRVVADNGYSRVVTRVQPSNVT